MFQKLRIFHRLSLLTTLLVFLAFLLLSASLMGGVFSSGPNHQAVAATSSTINFQARLLTNTGALVPDGNYHVEFKLFDASSSAGSSQGSCSGDSNCLWTETRTTGNLVRVVNGYLTVNLGSVNAFGSSIDWDQELWLTMNVGGTGGSPSWDGEMTPRLKLSAVPYAFKAGQLAKRTGADTSTLDFATQTGARSILLPDESGTICLQGSANCGFAASSGSSNYIQNGTSPQTADFNITGDGTVGDDFTVNGDTLLSTTSATAFTIQNASAQSLFVANTSTQRIAIGPAAVAANGVLTIGTNTTVASGGIYFGTDTNLYRSANDTLKTDDTFHVVGQLITGSSSVGSSTVISARDNVGGSTHILWVARGTNNGGSVIRIGGASDQNLTANVLQTSRSGEAQNRFNLQWGGTLLWGDGSTSLDTNLYRGAANQLQTDDSLYVGANLNVTSDITGSGNLSVTGNITGNGTFLHQNSSNSSTAFQIQNATGSSLFTVDTTNSAITVTDLLPSTAGTGAVISSLNTPVTIDSTGTVGQYNSMVLGADGFSRISYYDSTNGDLKFAQCTNADCSTKNITTVDSTGDVGRWTSMVLGADGFARISYYDVTNQDLKFAQCTNADCSASNIVTVDSTNNVGQFTAITLGADGFARIAYNYVTSEDLKFAQCTNADCSTKNITTVDSATVGRTPSIAMAADGFARISYYDITNQDLKFAQCTNAACTTSNITAVDSSTNIGLHTSLALGTDGFARISYYSTSTADLKFAQCTNAACTTSTITTVDSTGLVGQYTSLALDSNDFARISYYDSTNGDVKFAQCTNADCSTKNLVATNSPDNIGQYTSLAMGADGLPRISYYDVTNGDLGLISVKGTSIGSGTNPFGAIWGTQINAFTGFTVNGNVGVSTTCSGGQFLQDQVVTGGIVTGGTCVSGGGGSGDILQGGNSFTAAMTIGTNDTYDLNFETDGTTRITIDTSGNTTFNGHVLPGTDDTYDLGSDTNRWRDLYVGPATINIGTSNTDQGTISYDTSANNLLLGTTSGGVVIQNSTDTTTAFQIQNQAGTSNLFVADTTNNRIGIGTNTPQHSLDVRAAANGARGIFFQNNDVGSSAAGYLLFGNDVGLAGGIAVNSSANTGRGGANSVNLVNLMAANLTLGTSNTVQATIGSNGATTFKNSANSANAFRVQNAAANDLFKIDTTTANISVGTTEVGDVQGWITDTDEFPTSNPNIHFSKSVYDIDNNLMFTIGHDEDNDTWDIYYNSPSGGDVGYSSWDPLSGLMSGLPNLPIRDIATYNGRVYVALRAGANTTSVYYTNDYSTWNSTIISGLPISGAIAVANGYIYVFERSGDGIGIGAVYYTLDGSGAPTGGAVTNGPLLPNDFETTGNITQQAVAMDDYVYIYDNVNNTLAWATQSGGTLSSFSTTNPTVGGAGAALAASPNSGSIYCEPPFGTCRLWLVGGSSDEIWYADAATPTSWFQTSYNLPEELTNAGAVVTDETQSWYDWTLYTIGGKESGGTNSGDVYSAYSPDWYGGDTDPWYQTSYPLQTTLLPMGVHGAGTVILNGKIYSIGGYDYNNNDYVGKVFSSSLNSNGSISSWQFNSSIPYNIAYSATTVANGRVYVMGGYAGTNMYIGRLSSSGNLSFSTTGTTAIPQGVISATAVFTGKRIYLIGGDASGATANVRMSNELGADGAVTSWSSGPSLPAARGYHSSVVANGYVYVLGGYNGSAQSSVYYAKINSDGTIGSWSTNGNSLPAGVASGSAVALNGYIYVLGGGSNVYYAKLNSDGSTGVWQTASNGLPQSTNHQSAVVANGYIYSVGGAAGSGSIATTSYASTQRIQIAGSLDLVGAYNVEDLDSIGSGSAGGTLTAGSTTIVGSLDVIGEASFNQNLDLNNNLNVGGDAYIGGTLNLGDSSSIYQSATDVLKTDDSLLVQTAANTVTGFQVLNSTGSEQLTVDTTNSRVYIGDTTADSTGTVLVLDTKNTSGDPTGVNGAMYYNSNSNTFRCYENSTWKDCLSRHVIALGSDVTDNSGNCTFTNVTGLSFSVASGVNYRYHANIIYTSAATTTGLGLAVNGPSSPTLLASNALIAATLNTGAFLHANTYDGNSCLTSAPSTSSAGNSASLEGVIRPSSAGTLQLRFATEVNGSAVVIKAGSTLEWW